MESDQTPSDATSEINAFIFGDLLDSYSPSLDLTTHPLSSDPFQDYLNFSLWVHSQSHSIELILPSEDFPATTISALYDTNLDHHQSYSRIIEGGIQLTQKAKEKRIEELQLDLFMDQISSEDNSLILERQREVIDDEMDLLEKRCLGQFLENNWTSNYMVNI
jgi:hypothetical protein